MEYPNFFDEVPKICIIEPLGETLGSFSGMLKYRYLDCVKLAGHSCPTVAGAFLFCLNGLRALYKDETPIRGNIAIEFSGQKADGVTGVIANVISYITGAKEDDGFKGLGGKFCRANLLKFGCDINCEVRFTRLDNMQYVDMNYMLAKLPLSNIDMTKIPKMLNNELSPKEEDEFHKAWQERVKEILLKFTYQAIEIKN